MPRKSLGQNFLVDRRAARRIVEALDLRDGEPVLEIGPGRGALTSDLLQSTRRLAAVELDTELARRLEESFGTRRLLLFNQDALRIDPLEVLSALGAPADAQLVIVGNLPYNISKPIAQWLVRERGRIGRAVLMFQREVAQRLTAAPGSRNYGPLSILVGLCYRVEPLFDLSPRCFFPRPRVVSTVTHWSARSEGFLERDTETRLRLVLTACFARRRKTLRNNLRALFEDESIVDDLLSAADLDGGLRPEAVPPEGFLRLAARWPALPLI
jgi:16S rRNA (adenine1518-N6/adenine1519-N6)-dimethyltransferase